MAMSKTMTSQTLILATEGCYCDSDIEVTAALQEKSATANGDVVPDVGYTGLSKVAVNVPDIPSFVPVDVATAAEMAALLTEANVGKVYRFTGTTDETYTNGDFYEVVSSSGG